VYDLATSIIIHFSIFIHTALRSERYYIMAKAYNYMVNAQYSLFSFGILIDILNGFVETKWKVPAKYAELVKEYIYTHYGRADSPAVDFNEVNGLVVTFRLNIDYSEVFEGFEDIHGGSLNKLNHITQMRDEAINAACLKLTKLKENLQDTARYKYYLARTIHNAASLS